MDTKVRRLERRVVRVSAAWSITSELQAFSMVLSIVAIGGFPLERNKHIVAVFRDQRVR